MPRLNFQEIEPTFSPSEDLDQFEKFAKIFFEKVLKGRVTKGPTRGADGGIDLRVEMEENGAIIRKLVSCKHNAFSKTSVGIDDEKNVLDRLGSFGCTVFVGFYSTIASTPLEQRLENLRREKGIEFELFNSEDIETHLLESHAGFMVAKRFFPISVRNIWPRVISLEKTYSLDDAVQIDDRWIVPSAFVDGGPGIWTYSAEDAVTAANEKAMHDVHYPMFLSAWKDAVRYYPDFFEIPACGIDAAESTKQLPPKWEAIAEIGAQLRPNQRWGLLAIWSLVDATRVRIILKEMHHDASQQDLDLMSFSWLAQSTATDRRDILTRLFAYCSH